MTVHVPLDQMRRQPRASIRLDARLDAAARQKVDDLAGHFRRPRAAVLRHILQWSLEDGIIATRDQGKGQSPVCHLYCYVDADLCDAVQQAATTAGVKMAPWLCHMMRHVTLTDFPAS